MSTSQFPYVRNVSQLIRVTLVSSLLPFHEFSEQTGNPTLLLVSRHQFFPGILAVMTFYPGMKLFTSLKQPLTQLALPQTITWDCWRRLIALSEEIHNKISINITYFQFLREIPQVSPSVLDFHEVCLLLDPKYSFYRIKQGRLTGNIRGCYGYG